MSLLQKKRVRKTTTLIYYKATVIEIVWYWHKNRNRSMGRDSKPKDKDYNHTVYDKGCKNI